jgi:glutamyl-tRNA reductase
MHILCLGLNHTITSVHLRERLTLNEEQVRASLSRLGCGHIDSVGAEMAIISTCNRIEIYATSSRISFAELEVFLSDTRGVLLNELHPHLYRLVDAEAVRHLMEVAGGLDSLVLGEPQILGQVTRALELARGVGSAGPLLTRFFQAAIHAGKRVRTETAISRNPASVSSLAAGLCERSVPDIRPAQVVILGAGEMAELAVESLRKRGVKRLVVINRTLERARALADRWTAEADTFENLESALIRADILISSTSAPHMLIHPQMVAASMRQRPDRPLVLIDIAVPRDIDPEVAQIPNVHLHNIDNLNANLEQSLAERAAEVPQAKAILAEEEAKFLEFLGTLDMLPLITDIHQQAEIIRHAELKKTLSHLPDLTEAERSHIEAMSQALVKKLLANPTNHLRAESRSPRAPEIASLTRMLFNLQKRHIPHDFSGDSLSASPAAD